MKKATAPNRNLATPQLKTLAAPPGAATATAHRPSRFNKHSPPKRMSTPPNGGAPTSMEHGETLSAEQVLAALIALKQGNFNARLPGAWTAIAGKVADIFNDVAEMMAQSTTELSRISRGVGNEGRIHERLTS